MVIRSCPAWAVSKLVLGVSGTSVDTSLVLPWAVTCDTAMAFLWTGTTTFLCTTHLLRTSSNPAMTNVTDLTDVTDTRRNLSHVPLPITLSSSPLADGCPISRPLFLTLLLYRDAGTSARYFEQVLRVRYCSRQKARRRASCHSSGPVYGSFSPQKLAANLSAEEPMLWTGEAQLPVEAPSGTYRSVSSAA